MLLVARQTHFFGEAHFVRVDAVCGQVGSTVMAIARFAPTLGVVGSVCMWAFVNLVLLDVLGGILD